MKSRAQKIDGAQYSISQASERAEIQKSLAHIEFKVWYYETAAKGSGIGQGRD